jgi:hypothetical protein
LNKKPTFVGFRSPLSGSENPQIGLAFTLLSGSFPDSLYGINRAAAFLVYTIYGLSKRYPTRHGD